MIIKTLFLGDVVGVKAQDKVVSQVPQWKKQWGLDCVVVNGENAAPGGCGITADICKRFYEAGVDCITTGNHIWDQKEIIPYIDKDDRLLRPFNFAEGTPGQGHVLLATPSGANILVVNIILRNFMSDLSNDPFASMESLFSKYKLGNNVNAIIVDIHGETTAEKTAFGYMCDGRASLVVGTHTHVPTSDYQILPKGTAYQTDAGMCGSYESVIGFKQSNIVKRFQQKVPKPYFIVSESEEITLSGLYIETDKKTGLALRVEQVIFGGKLRQSLPDFSVNSGKLDCA